MSGTPPIDLSGFPVLDDEGTIARLKGDKEFLLTLLEVYREDLPDKLSAIRSGLDKGDLDAVQRAAHSLKGASATVGATAMREVAYAMETAARNGDAAGSGQLAEPLARQTELVLERIGGILGG